MRCLMSVIGLCCATSVAATGETVLTVPGYANPYLAGMDPGATASRGDTAPEQSPILLMDFDIGPGDVLRITATGSVSNTSGPSGVGPDGGAILEHYDGATNGLSGIAAPINSLLGVFLGAGVPANPPDDLKYLTAEARNFTSFAPALGQVFFVGDGLDGAGARQQFIVPHNAKRLYLATMDGFGWYNNSGAFEVTVGHVGLTQQGD